MSIKLLARPETSVDLKEPSPGNRRFQPDFPEFHQLARTGATRFMPSLRGDKWGRVLTYWMDKISIEEYDEMRMDGQCRAGLQLVKLPVQRGNWTVQCESTEISAFIQEAIKPVYPRMIRQLLLGLDFGHSLFEIMWKAEYNLRVTETQGQAGGDSVRTYPYAITVDDVLHMDPLTYWLLSYRRSGRFAGFNQYTPYNVSVPERKALLFSNDIEFQEVYGVSRLKPCYPYWYINKLMYEMAGIYYETYSIPMKVGRTPTGKDPESGISWSDNMMDVLEELRNNHAVVLPNAQDSNGNFMHSIELLESGRTGGDHIQFINHNNYMILKSLLVPQLAIETGESGTYNLAEEQIDFFLQSEEALGEQIASSLTTLVDRLVKYNFGEKAPKALFKFSPFTRDMRQGLIELLMQTVGSGQPIPMKDGGAFLPDWGWIIEKTGFPVEWLDDSDLEAFKQADNLINPPPPIVGPDGQPIAQGQPGQSGQPGQGGGPPQTPSQPAQGSQQPTTPEPKQTNASEEDFGEFVLDGGELVWVTR